MRGFFMRGWRPHTSLLFELRIETSWRERGAKFNKRTILAPRSSCPEKYLQELSAGTLESATSWRFFKGTVRRAAGGNCLSQPLDRCDLGRCGSTPVATDGDLIACITDKAATPTADWVNSDSDSQPTYNTGGNGMNGLSVCTFGLSPNLGALISPQGLLQTSGEVFIVTEASEDPASNQFTMLNSVGADARLRGAANGSRRAAEQRTDAANEAYVDIYPVVSKLRQEGLTLRAIAHRLDEMGHSTRRGKNWNPMQVSAVLARVSAKA